MAQLALGVLTQLDTLWIECPVGCTVVGVRCSLMSSLIVLVGSVTSGRVALVAMVATPLALWGIDLESPATNSSL